MSGMSGAFVVVISYMLGESLCHDELSTYFSKLRTGRKRAKNRASKEQFAAMALAASVAAGQDEATASAQAERVSQVAVEQLGWESPKLYRAWDAADPNDTIDYMEGIPRRGILVFRSVSEARQFVKKQYHYPTVPGVKMDYSSLSIRGFVCIDHEGNVVFGDHAWGIHPSVEEMQALVDKAKSKDDDWETLVRESEQPAQATSAVAPVEGATGSSLPPTEGMTPSVIA